MHSHEALSRPHHGALPPVALPAPASPGLRRRAARARFRPAGELRSPDFRPLGHGVGAARSRRLCRVPERLTPLDASFLHTETASAHMHVAWMGRFRPEPVAPADHARARAGAGGVAARAGRRVPHAAGVPARRVRGAGVGRRTRGSTCGATWWRSAAMTSCSRGGVRRAGRRGALQPLDRSHPLWEIHLAPRLEDGSVGLVMKIHHAMVDGKSALAVALLLLDLDPDAPEPAPPAEAWAADRAPGPARLAVEALVGSGAEPLRALGRAARAASSPPRLGGTLRRAALAVGEDVARSAPSSFLNPAIGPRRTLVGHTVDVQRLLDVKRAWGGSLNDVALTVVAGALRQLALLRRVAPAPMKVMVPVSRRGEDEMADMGNRIAFVFIDLPVHLRDPLARLAAIRDATASFKDSERASGGEALMTGSGCCRCRCRRRSRATRRRRGCTTSSSPTCPGRGCPSTCSAPSASRCSRRSRSPRATRCRSASSPSATASASACTRTRRRCRRCASCRPP